jgi:hypothetical protein
MAIIDTYNKSKLAEKNADKQAVDFIKNKKFGTEAVNGFIPNKKTGDKSDFNMIDANGTKTTKTFDVLSNNGTKEAPYTQTKKGFMNLTAKAAASPGCPCKQVDSTITVNGVEWNVCAGVGGDGQKDKMCRKGAGPVKDKDFVGNNSRVFKGDKSFVGDRM